MFNLNRRGDEDLPDCEENKQQAEEKTPEQNMRDKKKCRDSVAMYMIVLFGVVILLILLSYYIQQRRNSDTISDLTEQHSSFSIQALANIEALQDKNQELTQNLTDALEKIEMLEEKLDSAETLWENEKSSNDLMKESYDELNMSYKALEKLMIIKDALEKGDKDAARGYLSELETMKDHLSEERLAEYEALILSLE